ncbi:hypothetical protein [Tenacibaculum aiptasiae]|uniref:hypothetical protein n=1 Tax=Tenacibaculum aiptasiae TaxID=426481 RepID=UPI003B594D65
MILEILPNKGFKINTDIFNWNEDRKLVRQKLKDKHKEEDETIEVSQFFDGDTSHNIEQRRDVYQNIKEEENYFFLNYNKNNQLQELEIHWGVKVKINKIEMEFGKDITSYLNQLSSQGYEFKEIEHGNYLFKELKIVIANAEAMGADGNGFSYIFTTQDIEHLIKD